MYYIIRRLNILVSVLWESKTKKSTKALSSLRLKCLFSLAKYRYYYGGEYSYIIHYDTSAAGRRKKIDDKSLKYTNRPIMAGRLF